jgi:hypothetical protein
MKSIHLKCQFGNADLNRCAIPSPDAPPFGRFLNVLACSGIHPYSTGPKGVELQKFVYRSPRYPVDLPARLIIEQSTFIGRCKNISSEGMKLELRQALPPNACGTVYVDFQDRTLELNVRVAHAGAAQGGMEFLYQTESERHAVATLLASLSASQLSAS